MSDDSREESAAAWCVITTKFRARKLRRQSRKKPANRLRSSDQAKILLVDPEPSVLEAVQAM